MLPTPAGWRVARCSNVLELESVHGAGTIVIEEGVAYSGAGPVLAGGERTATDEGERAIIAPTHAWVVLDDSCIRIEGRPAHASGAKLVAKAIQDIVATTRLFLGEARRRRCWYEAPAGFQLVADPSGEDTWLATGAQRAALTVTRALPVAAREHVSMVKTLLDGDAATAPTPVTTARGLRGQLWQRAVTTPDGERVTIAVVALSDGRHDYFVRAIAADALRLLAPVLESIEPLPRPFVPVATSVMDYWAA